MIYKTNQEVFDKVAKHLLTQNEKAINRMNGHCSYRASNKMCAIGCLIPDEIYSENMENNPISDLFEISSDIRLLFQNIDEELLDDLQGVHDNCGTGLWKSKLGRIAYSYKLDDSILNNF